MIRIAALTISVLVLPGPAVAAQSVPTTFRDLSAVVKPGAAVTVFDRAGAEVSGRIDALTDAEIALRTPLGERRLAEGDVMLIQQRRADTLLDGTLMGLAIGGGAGLLMEATCGPRSICAEAPNGQMLIGGLVWGTGIGLLVDALRKSPQAIFKAGPRPAATLTVSPVVGRRHAGARLALAW